MPTRHPIDPEECFGRLQTEFVAAPDEAILESIGDLGRMMAVSGLPLEGVLDVHCAGLSEALRLAPTQSDEVVSAATTCLSELMVAWRTTTENIGLRPAETPEHGPPLFLRFFADGRIAVEDWDAPAALPVTDGPPPSTLDELLADLAPLARGDHLAAALRNRRILVAECRPFASGRRFKLVICPFQHGDGIIALHDVTEQLALAEARQQRQKLESLGQLAGGIAHEINNLLQPILYAAKFIQEDHPDQPDIVENAQMIVDSANTAAGVVRGILAFSRRNAMRRETVRLGPTVAVELDRLRTTLPAGVALIADLDRAGDATTEANAGEVSQILRNLVGNAADAMTGEGRVSVALDPLDLGKTEALRLAVPEGRYLRLSVSDDGPGIPPVVVGRIFDPFFTTKDVGKGTGLGLSIVRGIIESWKGTIALHEGGPGTTFDLFFPISTVVTADAQPAAPAIPAGDGRVILVVDDDSRIRSGVVRILDRAGYRPREAASAREALTFLDTASADLVLTDLMMPDGDGVELISQARARWPDLPLLAITGSGESDIKARAEQAGASAFLSKPVSSETLLKTIAASIRSQPDGHADDNPTRV